MVGRYPTDDLWILWGPRIFYIVEVGHVSLPVENHSYPKVCKLVLPANQTKIVLHSL